MQRVSIVRGSRAGGTAVGLSALLAAGLIARQAGLLAHQAGPCFVGGIVLFCGAAHALAFAGLRAGPIAPVGGTVLMPGWLLLAASALMRWRNG